MKAVILCYLACLPLKTLYITSPYGIRRHPLTGHYAFHNGVDLRAAYDTVYAVMDGCVQRTGYECRLGAYIRLGNNGLTAVYGHLSRLLVTQGDQVNAGDPIAITGNTGRVTGGHLHFSMAYQGRYINPLNFLYRMLIQQDHE